MIPPAPASDWDEIGRLAPGSPADMAARANIEHLAAGDAASRRPPRPARRRRNERQAFSRGPRRRSVIAGAMAALGAGIAAAAFPACRNAAETESLRQLAADKGLFYGTTISA